MAAETGTGAVRLRIAQARVVPEPRNRTLEVLRALGHPMRLELIAQIAARGPVCTCHLQEALSCSQPTLSKQLGVLRRAGLITGRREGRWVYYSLDEEALEAGRGFLDELYASTHRPHSTDRCDDPT